VRVNGFLAKAFSPGDLARVMEAALEPPSA